MGQDLIVGSLSEVVTVSSVLWPSISCYCLCSTQMVQAEVKQGESELDLHLTFCLKEVNWTINLCP